MRTLLILLDKEFRQFIRNSFLPKVALIFPLMIMLVMPWVMTLDVRHIGIAIIDNDSTSIYITYTSLVLRDDCTT